MSFITFVIVLFFFFNWRIIALQCCVGFCHTIAWIIHKYTYITSLLGLPPSPAIPPLQLVSLHWFELPVLCNVPLALCFTEGSTYVLMLHSQFIPPSPSPTVSTNLFSMSASLFLPCPYAHQSHFPRFHVYALIYNICFSLSDLLHSV